MPPVASLTGDQGVSQPGRLRRAADPVLATRQVNAGGVGAERGQFRGARRPVPRALPCASLLLGAMAVGKIGIHTGLLGRARTGPGWQEMDSGVGENFRGSLANERWPTRTQTGFGAYAPMNKGGLAAGRARRLQDSEDLVSP